MLPSLERFGFLEGVSIRLYEDRDFDYAYHTIREIGEGTLGKGLRGWDELFSAPNGIIWTAETEDHPIGFAAAQDYGNGVVVFHSDLVHPDQQRKGVGTSLVLTRLATTDADEIEEIGLLETEFSRPFYEQFGFRLKEQPTDDPFAKVTLHPMSRDFDQALSDEAWKRLTDSKVNVAIDA